MRWEYLVISKQGRSAYQNELQRYGSEGWELVSVIWTRSASEYIFKRPKDETTKH